jgi:hypothetical protein
VDPRWREQATTTGKSFQDNASREGATQRGAAVIRPKWSRFSPRKLAEEEGIGGKSDAFNKVSDVLGRRRH